MSFNTRRASDFKQCDYLKPTLSSMSRAKSVVPHKNKQNERRGPHQIIDENTSFDFSC